MKIAIIGERDFIWGFKGVGFFTFPVGDSSQAARPERSMKLAKETIH